MSREVIILIISLVSHNARNTEHNQKSDGCSCIDCYQTHFKELVSE